LLNRNNGISANSSTTLDVFVPLKHLFGIAQQRCSQKGYAETVVFRRSIAASNSNHIRERSTLLSIFLVVLLFSFAWLL
jgi:hypothetical protein